MASNKNEFDLNETKKRNLQQLILIIIGIIQFLN